MIVIPIEHDGDNEGYEFHVRGREGLRGVALTVKGPLLDLELYLNEEDAAKLARALEQTA